MTKSKQIKIIHPILAHATPGGGVEYRTPSATGATGTRSQIEDFRELVFQYILANPDCTLGAIIAHFNVSMDRAHRATTFHRECGVITATPHPSHKKGGRILTFRVTNGR